MRVTAVCLLVSAARCLATDDSLPNKPAVSKADVFASALRGGRGFADADPESDESMKMIRNVGLHHPQGVHKTVPSRSSTIRDSDERAIQTEIESMVHRVKLLSDKDAFEFIKELDGLEENLAKTSSEDRGLVQEISAVRADLCARKGFTDGDADQCEDFMHKACVIDGISKDAAPIVPEEDCIKFYSMGGRINATAAAAPVPAPAAAPVSAPGAKEPEEPDGWSMKVRPLPDQGFEGPLKQHEDMDTATKDWRKEFGPHSGHESYEQICAKYPKNEWCRLHGFFRSEPVAAPMKGSAAERPFALSILVLAATMLRW